MLPCGNKCNICVSAISLLLVTSSRCITRFVLLVIEIYRTFCCTRGVFLIMNIIIKELLNCLLNDPHPYPWERSTIHILLIFACSPAADTEKHVSKNSKTQRWWELEHETRTQGIPTAPELFTPLKGFCQPQRPPAHLSAPFGITLFFFPRMIFSLFRRSFLVF